MERGLFSYEGLTSKRLTKENFSADDERKTNKSNHGNKSSCWLNLCFCFFIFFHQQVLIRVQKKCFQTKRLIVIVYKE